MVRKAKKDAVLGALEANDIVDESSNETATEDELEDKETECIEGEQCKFTADLLAKIVDEVKQCIVNNDVFSKTIREELMAYLFTNLPEESM
ncbi:hypothetical protein P5673_023137 [Acropora cervicornis]|uniref:Uncharacterized protein n=1 Tax=Acropora cervicornis TaxID=6130 RepID=A0AAD9Q5H6_ACRCE|nr:hypothetical protein P5673_023137 [Acropora cervicornis]